MKNAFVVSIALALVLFGWIGSAKAVEEGVSYTIEPFARYTIINKEGDKEKFREDMQRKDELAGGLQEFTFSPKVKDIKVDVEGRAIPNENDYKLDLSIVKEDLYSLTSGFKEFARYYDGTGGFYRPSTNLRSIDLAKDLKLIDSHFFIDFEYNKPDEPLYFVNYERHAKSGAMSSLSWNSVINAAGTTRKIAPSYKEIDEVQHTIELGLEDKANVFKKEVNYKLEQKLLYFNEKSLRVERKFGATAAANAIDTQEEKPQSNSYATTLLADSRINDKVYLSSSAQYEHTHASVWEDLKELNLTTNAPTNYTANTENFFGSTALNDLDVYSWNAALLIDPLKYLSVTGKVKAEVKRRDSSSDYPRDTTAIADFIIDNVSISNTNSYYKSFTESLGLRYTKLPKTTLYIDGDFEQIDGQLKERRFNLARTTETFDRYTDIATHKNSITTGFNWYPASFVSLASQFRKDFSKDGYSDREETPTTTTAFSGFVDKETFDSETFTTKINVKPYKWLHGLIKHQYKNSNIDTGIEGQGTAKENRNVHTILGSLTFIPNQKLYLTGMFSRQTSVTETVARMVRAAVVPAYEASVNTAAVSATWLIDSKASLDAQYQLVRPDESNFKDVSAFGMPYGVSSIWHRVWTSFKYDVKEDISTEVSYGLATYEEESNDNIDDYIAHIIGGKLKYAF